MNQFQENHQARIANPQPAVVAAQAVFLGFSVSLVIWNFPGIWIL
jgi:hypothetical protein